MRHKLLMVLCAMMATVSAIAYDFEYVHNDNTLYFNITSDNTCEITRGVIAGALDIPSSVTYSGATYTVTSIGEWAFQDCVDLTSVTIPNSVTTIRSASFSGCSGLTSVSIPNSVITIGSSTFYGCSSLTFVDIPNSITEINSHTFWECSSLVTVNIPNSVTKIGSYAFYRCGSLASVTIPASVTTICSSVFQDCSSLTSIVIPNSVKTIDDYAFSGCSSLTSVNFGNSVTTIGPGSFSACGGLTSLTIPNTVTTIGFDAFSSCYNLETLIIPSSVTLIDNYAFGHCRKLESITVENNDPANISLGGNIFYNVPTSTCVLYVPRGSEALYAAADQWKMFDNIVEIEPPYAFEAEETDIKAGRVVTVPVSMVNEDSVIGFQCDIELPEDMELALDEDGEYYLEDTGRFANHQVSANAVGGSVRFMVVSMNNKAFRGNDGVLFGIPVIANGDPCATEIRVHNIKLSDVNAVEVELPDLYIPVNVLPPYTHGDVNGDDAITVTDVTMTIAAALGNNLPGFVLEAADIDGNGRISVSDVTAIIYMVLNQDNR